MLRACALHAANRVLMALQCFASLQEEWQFFHMAIVDDDSVQQKTVWILRVKTTHNTYGKQTQYSTICFWHHITGYSTHRINLGH